MNSEQLIDSQLDLLGGSDGKKKAGWSAKETRSGDAGGGGRGLRGLATGTVVMQNQALPAPRALDPGAQPHFEGVSEELVAREDAHAVVQAAGEPGLHLDAVAMLAVPHVAGI